MKSAAFRMICRLLVGSLVLMNFPMAQASMIGVDQVITPTSVALDRAAVLETLGRTDVANQLQAQGVDPQLARERVGAMTDEEVHSLRGQIDSLPAGAKSNAWWIAAVVIVAVIVWWLWK